MAKIENLNYGKDGLVRSCVLKLSNGNMIQRSVKLLCPIEISEVDKNDKEVNDAEWEENYVEKEDESSDKRKKWNWNK